jgi:hypothetical protein
MSRWKSFARHALDTALDTAAKRFETEDNWYPRRVLVGPEGVPGTYEFMSSIFAAEQSFTYAEFGIYRADTADKVCQLFNKSTLYLFDFNNTIDRAKKRLSVYQDRIYYFGNTQKYNDSYNWSLMKLIRETNGGKLFDYCFLDGAHTVAVDALTFFLCDRLLKVGGYMDFDDYGWRLRESSLDPAKVSVTAKQYTDEQIDAYQVAMIVDDIVKRDKRYKEIVTNKIFQKVSE